jgi:hypothetical protein
MINIAAIIATVTVVISTVTGIATYMTLTQPLEAPIRRSP